MSQNVWATIMPFGPVTLIFYWPKKKISGHPKADPHFRHCSDRSPLEEQFCVFKILEMSAKTRHKKWAVKIQHCPISSKFYMWVDNDVPTLKNF